MTGAERKAKIEEAIALVREVDTDLNAKVTPCECCGSQRYDHYGEYRAHVELVGMITKLDKWGASFERGLNKEKVE